MTYSPKVTLKFDAMPRAGNAPLQVKFTDETEGVALTHWRWDFGDGEHSEEQNPSHTYTKPGKYHAQMEGHALGVGVGLGRSKYMEIEAYPSETMSVGGTTARQLPIEKINGKKYYRDDRLRQYRNVEDPHDFFSFAERPSEITGQGGEGEREYKVTFTCKECGFKYSMETMLTKEEAEAYLKDRETVKKILICPKCSKFGTGTLTVEKMEPEGEDLCDIVVKAALGVIQDKCGAAGCARKNVKLGGATVVVEYPSAEVEVIVKSSTLAFPDKVRILTEMKWLKEFATNYICETMKMCGQKVPDDFLKSIITSTAQDVAEQLVVAE